MRPSGCLLARLMGIEDFYLPGFIYLGKAATCGSESVRLMDSWILETQLINSPTHVASFRASSQFSKFRQDLLLFNIVLRTCVIIKSLPFSISLSNHCYNKCARTVQILRISLQFDTMGSTSVILLRFNSVEHRVF